MLLININPLIEEIFSNFTVGGKIIPISFLNYTGNSDVYLTYYTWYDKPENFYDDENHAEIAFGTIDIYSKGNYKPIEKALKALLESAGFMWEVERTSEDMYEDDTKYYHKTLCFSIERSE